MTTAFHDLITNDNVSIYHSKVLHFGGDEEIIEVGNLFLDAGDEDFTPGVVFTDDYYLGNVTMSTNSEGPATNIFKMDDRQFSKVPS